MATTKTFSLYLAKVSALKHEDLLTKKALDLLKNGKAKSIPGPEFGDGAVLYTFPSFSGEPKWVDLLRTTFAIPGQLNAQSPSAVLAFEKDKRLFAVTFSYGHVYLDEAKTQADFGLRASINALSDGKLKSVERANIGAAIRDFAQAAGQRDLRTFGFDDALDLIRKVSGHVSEDDFADRVTGARALRFTKQLELDDVPDAAADALKLFNGVAYKKTAFRIIDFLSPVLDPTKIEELDDALVTAIRDGSDEFEISLPEITSNDVGTFRFELTGESAFHADLSLDLYRDALGKKLATLDVENLKHHRVAGYSTAHDKLIGYWHVHDALVGSIAVGKDRFAINEGYWYQLGPAYKKAADEKFASLVVAPDKKLLPFKQMVTAKVKGKKVKPGFQSEESYNEEIAKSNSGYLLMDQKFIQIDEVPGPGIEACDLLDIPKRRFIHVKKSSRQSSVLSHFFKQGGNAAQMLKKYPAYRAALIATVKKHHGAKLANDFEVALDKKWTVEFQIADYPRKNGQFNIPFFSKLSLRDEARNLEAMEFDVAIGFIRVAGAK